MKHLTPMKNPQQTICSAIAVLAVCFILSACGRSAPSPGDPDVQKLTLEVCDELLRDQILIPIATNETGISAAAMPRSGYPSLKYREWKKVAAENPIIEKAIKQVDERMKEIKLSLSATRLANSDKKTRKTEFAAQLNLGNGNSIPITASAQYTEEGQLYVEVQLKE